MSIARYNDEFIAVHVFVMPRLLAGLQIVKYRQHLLHVLGAVYIYTVYICT